MKNLIRAELHKSYDTVAAKILIALIIGVACLISIVPIHLHAGNNVTVLFVMATQACHPFISILVSYFICQEWRHGLVLTTYVTTPKRRNVVIAKLCVVFIIFIVSLIFLLLFSFLFAFVVSLLSGTNLTFISNTAGDCASCGCIPYGMALACLTFSVLLATAMSYCIKDQTWSIAFYFVLPTLTVLLTYLPYLKEIDRWLVLAHVPSIGTPGVFVCEWYQIAVSTLIWIGIPLVVGIVRSIREDI